MLSAITLTAQGGRNSKRPKKILIRNDFFLNSLKKSQYKEKFERFNEHFKMPMLTFGPYASPGKINEFGVNGPFFRFFIIKNLILGFSFFQEFLNVIYVSHDRHLKLWFWRLRTYKFCIFWTYYCSYHALKLYQMVVFILKMIAITIPFQ